MGIMDFIKGGVQEMMIARPDEAKDRIVYKHPDDTIPMYSQLTVAADEAAVFFRDGSLVGSLRSAGVGQRHTLSSQNVPFLSNFVDSFTGGNVFRTQLFFVTMRPIYNVQFGGELGMMADPLLGEMVTPRVYGSMAFQVVNPDAFIVKYAGIRTIDDNEEVLKWVKGLMMNGVKTVVGEICVQEKKSLLDLMPLQQKLAQAFIARCPDLNDIGCAVTQMGQFNINLNDEDKRLLQKAQGEIGKAMRAAQAAQIGITEAEAKAKQKQFELDQQYGQDARYVQNLAGGNFGQYAAGRAMIGAGQGMAQGGGGDGGGAMTGGAALGVGMGMAQMFAQNVQQGQGQQAPAQARGPAPGGAPVTCPACAKSVPAGKFCQECGAGLAPKPRFCPACGVPGAANGRFCAECGTAFAQ